MPGGLLDPLEVEDSMLESDSRFGREGWEVEDVYSGLGTPRSRAT